jgi:hypothetical protein
MPGREGAHAWTGGRAGQVGRARTLGKGARTPVEGASMLGAKGAHARDVIKDVFG